MVDEMPAGRIRLPVPVGEISGFGVRSTRMMVPVEWRRVDTVGFERCELTDGLDGYRLGGTLGLMEGGESFDASYEVACDSAWMTRSVVVELRGPEGEKGL